jgi:hypothetical protein
MISTTLAPGIYPEHALSMEEYHGARDIIGRSALKSMDEGMPADTRRYLDSPPNAGSVAMAFGTAAQVAVRSLEDFKHSYIRQPVFAGAGADEEFKGTGAKARVAAWKAAHANANLLPAADYDAAIEVAHAIRACPSANLVLNRPDLQHETSFVWEEEKHGNRLVKARPDFWSPAAGLTADMKIDGRGDLSDHELSNYVAKYYAALQGAMCRRGLLALGQTWHSHVLIVARRNPSVKVKTILMQMDDGFEGLSWMKLANVQYDALLAEFVKCESTNEWPDWGDETTRLPVPAFVSMKATSYQARLTKAQENA